MQQTEKDRGMAGGCLTHGGRVVREVIVQLVTQTDPSSFSSLRVTCVRAYLFSNSRNATDAIYTRHRIQLYIPVAHVKSYIYAVLRAYRLIHVVPIEFQLSIFLYSYRIISFFNIYYYGLYVYSTNIDREKK